MSTPALDRRRFLQSLGVAGAASAVLMRDADAAPAPATSVPASSVRERPFVDLAIATICTDGFDHRRHEPAFRLIPETGISNVEFNVWFADTFI